MGTKIHCKSYFSGFYSMRDLNDDSSSSSWPLFYGDKTIANGQCHNGFMPSNGYPRHEKDTLKQKMLEHEAVFKNQVCELHRLYRIQRDMMEDVKRKHRASIEPASSSSLHGSQVLLEDARKWHMAGFPLLNSNYGRTSVAGVENFYSRMSCTKKQQGHFLQNGSTSKDSEALDSRPLKVRKKLFDLQLPADEYVDPDEEENLQQQKESDISSYTPNGNIKNGPESSMKFFLGGNAGLKTDSPMNASAPAPCLRGSIGLADLNEPIQIEEARAPSSIDFLGRTLDNVATHQPAKSTVGYLGITGETMHVRDGFLINSSNESQVNDRGPLSYINEAGSSRGNPTSIMHGYESDKSHLPCHPVQGMINQVHLPPGTYPSGYNREAPWRGFRHGLESSRSYDHSHNSHLEPIASQTPGSYPFVSSSSFASSWAHSVSSWQKPTSSFTQKVIEEPFGGKWHANYNSRSIPCSGNELKSNGFYHASALGLKELQVQCPSTSFDHLNCSRGDTVGYDRSTSENYPKGSCYVDSKPAININLNEDINAAGVDGKSKPEDNFSTLPWLKPKPVHVNEVADSRRSELPRELSYLHASSNRLCCKNETVRDVDKLFPSNVTLASCDSEKEIVPTHTFKKILGVPIFERNVRDNEASTSERKNGGIDINVACEPDEQIAAEEVSVEHEKQKKCHIDLNSCADDYEDPPEQKSASVKKTLEIDLEVPVFLEGEDDTTSFKENMPDKEDEQSVENKNEQIQDEVLRNAAEAILAISSCRQINMEDTVCLRSEASLDEAIIWFVDAASDEIVSTPAKESEIDDFVFMTLQLPETKEEDYMPTPFIPEIEKVEETSVNPLPSRPRRGHARRGRQRRDFQRDILPGLASLSRHEVTEDLQIFGGLMRATGHNWTSGLARRNGTRNGGGRGRRRAVVETVAPVITSPVSTPLMQQLNTIDGGLEDRSLTGWGKTTRRPRRQRCPAGTPPTVALM